jgi:hypothetical protein
MGDRKMKKSTVIAILAFPILMLLANVAHLQFLASFKNVNIAVKGYDPKDLFSGHYMNLQPDWDNTDCSQFSNGICPKKHFKPYYNYHIKMVQTEFLSKAVAEGRAELTFAYDEKFSPVVVGILIDGKPLAQVNK